MRRCTGGTATCGRTVPNAVQKRPNRPDDSFWQSMTTFIVGYGLNATMDTPAVRAQIAAGQAVAWPIVDINPALITGGERVNDSMRAALATRGDFYSANDPDQMRGRIRGVFRAIARRRSRAPAWVRPARSSRSVDAVPRVVHDAGLERQPVGVRRDRGRERGEECAARAGAAVDRQLPAVGSAQHRHVDRDEHRYSIQHFINARVRSSKPP